MADDGIKSEEVTTARFDALDRFAQRNRTDDQYSEVIVGVPSLIMRGAAYGIFAIIVVCFAIAYFTRLPVIVTTKGLIVPQGQNVAVEAQEAGIVVGIHTAPGERVREGEKLLTLQRSETGIDLKTLQDKLALESAKRDQLARSRDLTLEVARRPSLVIERDPTTFVETGPALPYLNTVRQARKQVDKAKEDIEHFLGQQRPLLVSQVEISREALKTQAQTVETARRALASNLQNLERKRDELKKMEHLAERRIVTQSQVTANQDQVIQTESQVNAQRQQISQGELEISRSRVQVSNMENELARQETGLRNELEKAQITYDQALADMTSAVTTLTTTISGAEAAVTEIRGRLKLQETQIEQLTITSPVTGVVTDFYFTTPGRLVARGNPVAMIVPEDARPIVIADVRNKDVAFVKEGIAARVKVDAYPHRQFGSIPGRVLRVYPRPDKPLFAVRVSLEAPTIKVRGEHVALKSGLTVEVDLITERQRLIEIMFKKMN